MSDIVKLKKYLAKDINDTIINSIKYDNMDPRPYFNGKRPADEELAHVSKVYKRLKEFSRDMSFQDILVSEEVNKLQEEYELYEKKYFDYVIFVDLIFHLEEFEIQELSN